MTRWSGAIIFILASAAGAAGGYWYARLPTATLAAATQLQPATPSVDRKILYYRDPDGASEWSAVPKQTPDGRDFLAVHDDEEVSFEPVKKPPPAAASSPRKILYYRNPMGLPDTSKTPKKDSMGMDYIPVYEGEEQDDGKTVKVSVDKIQRSGVRTESASSRVIIRPVRAVGTVAHDETRLTIVTVRSDGFIEDLFVNKTGQHVKAGEPLFRVYSPDIQRAQTDLFVAIRSLQRGTTGPEADRLLEGAMQRLRNLGVPDGRIQEIRDKGNNPRTLDWPAPATGDVIVKRIINGQRVVAGDELFRIADHSHIWIIADVAEGDLSAIKIGTRATVTVRAYSTDPIEGTVTFIYPELRTETRTARVRIEVQNPDGRLKTDMYTDVLLHAGSEGLPALSIPESAIIDSGTRQVVLIARGEGRFEPRPVKLGRRGGGYIEILEGVAKGDEVVTSATFLIDAESNLKAALQAFTQPEMQK